MGWWAACLRGSLGVALLAIVSLPAGPAAAQPVAGTPSTGPLPTVLYPSPSLHSRSPDLGPPAAKPKSDADQNDNGQIVYVVVGGVWGFWDLHHHFHRASRQTAPAIRSGAMHPKPIAYRAVTVTHTGSVAGSGHPR